MNTAPQIALSNVIFKEQPVVFINFKFSWGIVDRMNQIAVATYISSKKWGIIQEWLGHESSKTIEIYTHVSK